jgi:hypothetical protein
LKRSYLAVFSAARPQDARQVVLLVVDRSSGGHLRLVDAAAMLTTRDAGPADSSFEVIMADRLVGAGRASSSRCASTRATTCSSRTTS